MFPFDDVIMTCLTLPTANIYSVTDLMVHMSIHDELHGGVAIRPDYYIIYDTKMKLFFLKTISFQVM